jgi:hypothetical protein
MTPLMTERETIAHRVGWTQAIRAVTNLVSAMRATEADARSGPEWLGIIFDCLGEMREPWVEQIQTQTATADENISTHAKPFWLSEVIDPKD